jgi:hypothetical protein
VYRDPTKVVRQDSRGRGASAHCETAGTRVGYLRHGVEHRCVRRVLGRASPPAGDGSLSSLHLRAVLCVGVHLVASPVLSTCFGHTDSLLCPSLFLRQPTPCP